MFRFSVPVAVIMGSGTWTPSPLPCWLLLRAVQGMGSLGQYMKKAILALSKLKGRPAVDSVYITWYNI